jgi:hypothetical protein
MVMGIIYDEEIDEMILQFQNKNSRNYFKIFGLD